MVSCCRRWFVFFKEAGNEYDGTTVAVLRDILVEKIVVGHCPKLLNKAMAMFIPLPRTRIIYQITEKRVNIGAGYGLEILCVYKLCDGQKAISWMRRKY